MVQTRTTSPFEAGKVGELRSRFGQELGGEFASVASPAVSAGQYDGREWFVIDTAFAATYLILTDNHGGYLLLPIMFGLDGFRVDFGGGIPPQEDRSGKPASYFLCLQFLAFLSIASELLLE
jgi:hypothetical protein